ncbi:MAG: hypothetical protein WAN03_02820 [Candidatus Sulfotelmatobacter sp.]
MNANLLKWFPQFAMAGIMMLSLVSSAAARPSAAVVQKLQGSWMVTIQQRDCTTGVALGNPFLSLLTFHQGGTMTETTSNPMFYPNDRGPGHGVWITTGRNAYEATSTAFVTSNGVLTSTQVITQTIAIGDNPDQFETTKASVQFFDPSGNLLVSGCATASGQRIKLSE